MTALSQPVQVNMMHLLVRDMSAAVKNQPLKQDLKDAIQESTALFAEAVHSQLSGKFDYVVVTNKGNGPAYYVLNVHPKAIKLVEQTGFQKTATSFAIAKVELTLNERVVDDSFIPGFLDKIDRISRQLLSGEARALGQVREKDSQ